MAFCTNCGTQIQGGMKFCPNCGTPVVVPQPYTPPVQEPIQQPIQEEVPQYIPPMQQPVQEEVPQYIPPMQQPMQEEVPQYIPPVQESIQQEIPQYTPPVQEPIQQPMQEEVPQYTAPMQQEVPQYTPPMQQAQTEYTDDDLDMEGPPIVGNYTIPDVEEGAKTAKKASGKPAGQKIAKLSGAGSKLPIIIGAAALAIALVVCGIIFVPRMAGTPKVEGEGTALTDLLDNTAAYHYLGAGENEFGAENEDE